MYTKHIFLQKKEKKVMENHNVLKVTNSVLMYAFYRIVNSYKTEDDYNMTHPKFSFRGITGGGETMF